MAPANLTSYERQRLENIRRNEEMMAALKVRSIATELSAKRPRDGAKSSNAEKKPKSETPVVIRQSLRTRGKAPDSKDEDETTKPLKKMPSPRNLGPISMKDAYQGESSDRMLFEAFKGIRNKTQLSNMIDGDGDFKSSVKGNGSDSRNMIGASLKLEETDGVSKSSDDVVGLKIENLRLKPENVARVVPGRIMAMKFFPWAEKRMIVTGNNLGNIGFWNVDSREEETDGMYLYHPHPGLISGISIPRCSSSKMFTSCHAGCIKLMDAEKEVFDLIYSSDDTIYSLSQRPDDVKCLYFGEGKGGLNIWDERSGKSAAQWNLHDSRINTIDFNDQNPNIMSTSSTDGTACIWDLRSVNADKPRSLATVGHKRSVHSAYFSPSGKFLATTGLDCKVGILGGTNYEDSSMIFHVGSGTSTFRAIWGWDDSYIFVGNMKRGVDVISPARRQMIWTLKSSEISAIPCRFDIHPYNVGTLAGATTEGKIYMWTSD